MGFFSKLGNLFSRRGSEDEDNLSDDDTQEEEEDDEDTQGNEDTYTGELKVRVEKIQSLAHANRSTNKVLNEKIDKINEMLGSLRSMQSKQEQEITKFHADVDSTKKLVEQIEPQKIYRDYSKVIETEKALSEKVDVLNKTHKESMEEFKNLRKELNKSREVREVIRLGKDVREDVKRLKSLQVQNERDLRKTESINAHINKKFSDFLEYKKTATSIEEYYKKVTPDIEKIKQEIPDFVQKKEIDDIKSEIKDMEENLTRKSEEEVKLVNDAIEEITKIFGSVGKEKREFKTFVNNSKKDFEKFIEDSRKKMEDLTSVKDTKDKLDKMYAHLSDLDARQKEAEEKINKGHKRFESKLKEVDSIQDLVKQLNYERENFHNLLLNEKDQIKSFMEESREHLKALPELNDIRQKVDSFENDFESLKSKNEEFEKVLPVVQSLNNKVDNFDGEVEGIKSRQSDIDTSLSKIQSLSEKVEGFNKEFENLKSKYDDIHSTLSQLQGLNDKVDNLASGLEDVKSKNSELDKTLPELSDLKSQVKRFSDDVESVKSKHGEFENIITSEKQKMDELVELNLKLWNLVANIEQKIFDSSEISSGEVQKEARNILEKKNNHEDKSSRGILAGLKNTFR